LAEFGAETALVRPGFSQEQRTQLLGICERYAHISVAVFSQIRAWKDRNTLPEELSELVVDLAKGNGALSVVSFGNPYLIRQFPEVATYLCAYGNSPQLQRAAALTLFGRLQAKGKLPVELGQLQPLLH
jgi:beta-N-acetylhexosaminidase